MSTGLPTNATRTGPRAAARERRGRRSGRGRDDSGMTRTSRDRGPTHTNARVGRSSTPPTGHTSRARVRSTPATRCTGRASVTATSVTGSCGDHLCGRRAAGWYDRPVSAPARPVLTGILALAALPAAATPVQAAAPAPAARAYILVNPETGETLAARNPDAMFPMASTTKIMTALVVVDAAGLDEIAVVPASAVRVGESSAALRAGEQISVRDLLAGLVVGSGNDAALTLATHVAGSEAGFVRMMNRRAAELGLRHTRFRNPHGLDQPGHRSSARDLAVMGRAFMAVPELRRLAGLRRTTIPGPDGVGRRPLESHNLLLDLLPEADGVKTGNTDDAGYTLVAHAARRPLGVELYGVVLGSPSEARRAADMRRLLVWGFRQYARVELVGAGEMFARVPMRDRSGVRVDVLADGPPLRVPVRLGRPVRETVVVPAEVVGGVRRGQPLGRVTVRQGETVLGTRNLVAAADVSGPGVLDRLRAGVGSLLP